ncbi:MAG TPA: glycoside hydrolase family 2 TIM barrel-domain containing protein [Chloroflexota bacterium]
MRRRSRIDLAEGWFFHFGDEMIPWEGPRDGADWTAVSLPHSWNALDTMEPDPGARYRRGAGWYTRDLAPFPPADGQRQWLEVGAAAMKAEVYLGGRLIGTHAGGYTSFTVELTPALWGLPAGAPLNLSIRVDNSPDPDLIPSDMSDFFLYGGLTRGVWLFTTGRHALDAIFLDPVLSLSHGEGKVQLRSRLTEPANEPLSLHVKIDAPDGSTLVQAEAPITNGQIELALPSMQSVVPWSPDDPALYRATVRLEIDGQISDEIEERIGFRALDFPPGGPFFLNGERLFLQGTHRHAEWAGHGGAVPDDLSRSEMEAIRAAGFNFVRLAHYPQSATVLDACDELGLLAWEELPWCRGGVGGEQFQRQARQMLVEMIEQHYNHPSIIFWGLGNELDWESEHPNSTEDRVVAFLSELNDLSHSLDPRRLTALRRFERGSEVVDVYSPSIWAGWYRGRYEDYEAALTEAMERYPRMLHIEWGADCHVGRHSQGPHLPEVVARDTDAAEIPGIAVSSDGPPRVSRDGDWSESYALDLMEWYLQVQRRLPRLAGTAQWVFKDFGTPLRPENPIPYVNEKGLLDRAGQPKDVYRLFHCYQTDAPLCYIESPTWPVRVGHEEAPQLVRVYSNCERVELFLNGLSQGVRRLDRTRHPAAGLQWSVEMRPGPNELKALGSGPEGRVAEHTITQEYLIRPVRDAVATGFRCWAGPALSSHGASVTRFSVQLIDTDGHPVVNDRRRVGFRLLGRGRLIDNLGTVSGSRVVELANGRAAISVEVWGPASVEVEAAGISNTRFSLR